MRQIIKTMIKRILVIIWHPIVSLRMIKRGVKNLYIAPQMTINSLKKLYLGNNVTIGRNSRFLFVDSYYGGEYCPEIHIGSNSSIGNRFSVLSAAPIVIGDNSLIASDVLITSENHGMNPTLSDSYANIPLEAKAVTIGNGCWIGEKASIMPGVELGERCIVAAHSVVTKSFPAFSLVGGVPAKLIKKYNTETNQWEKCSDNTAKKS